MSDRLALNSFQELLPAADPQLSAACHAALVNHYTQPERAYHNLQHVAEVLEQAAAAAGQLKPEEWSQLALAIWFHDAIYDTHATDNEAVSARLAVEWLARLGVPAGDQRVVEELILATQHHTPHSRLEKIIVDADLAILGSPPASYQRYASAIRAEYSWVVEEAYRHGRSAVLQRFLDRPVIYHLPYFGAAYEAAARRNLQTELTSLSA